MGVLISLDDGTSTDPDHYRLEEDFHLANFSLFGPDPMIDHPYLWERQRRNPDRVKWTDIDNAKSARLHRRMEHDSGHDLNLRKRDCIDQQGHYCDPVYVSDYSGDETDEAASDDAVSDGASDAASDAASNDAASDDAASDNVAYYGATSHDTASDDASYDARDYDACYGDEDNSEYDASDSEYDASDRERDRCAMLGDAHCFAPLPPLLPGDCCAGEDDVDPYDLDPEGNLAPLPSLPADQEGNLAPLPPLPACYINEFLEYSYHY